MIKVLSRLFLFLFNESFIKNINIFYQKGYYLKKFYYGTINPTA